MWVGVGVDVRRWVGWVGVDVGGWGGGGCGCRWVGVGGCGCKWVGVGGWVWVGVGGCGCRWVSMGGWGGWVGRYVWACTHRRCDYYLSCTLCGILYVNCVQQCKC